MGMYTYTSVIYYIVIVLGYFCIRFVWVSTVDLRSAILELQGQVMGYYFSFTTFGLTKGNDWRFSLLIYTEFSWLFILWVDCPTQSQLLTYFLLSFIMFLLSNTLPHLCLSEQELLTLVDKLLPILQDGFIMSTRNVLLHSSFWGKSVNANSNLHNTSSWGRCVKVQNMWFSQCRGYVCYYWPWLSF